MSAPALEALLARLYVDAEARARFVADPRGEAMRAGLDGDECDAMARADLVGLEMAAASFAAKRAGRERRASATRRWLLALRRWREGAAQVLRRP